MKNEPVKVRLRKPAQNHAKQYSAGVEKWCCAALMLTYPAVVELL
jgi:hypothetical protein